MPIAVDAILGFTFGILALVIVTWIVVLIRELPENAPGLWKFITRISSAIFIAAPAQTDVKKSIFPVRFSIERILPIILWLLIIVPMVVFPIILILFPLLGIPWTYLLPPP